MTTPTEWLYGKSRKSKKEVVKSTAFALLAIALVVGFLWLIWWTVAGLVEAAESVQGPSDMWWWVLLAGIIGYLLGKNGGGK